LFYDGQLSSHASYSRVNLFELSQLILSLLAPYSFLPLYKFRFPIPLISA